MARMLKRDDQGQGCWWSVQSARSDSCSDGTVVATRAGVFWKERKAHCVVVSQVSDQKDNGGLTNVSRL